MVLFPATVVVRLQLFIVQSDLGSQPLCIKNAAAAAAAATDRATPCKASTVIPGARLNWNPIPLSLCDIFQSAAADIIQCS